MLFYFEMGDLRLKIILTLLLIITSVIFLYMENNKLTISHYKIKNNKISKAFRGFKIIHLSDFHSKEFGKKNTRMIKILEKESPDIIVITGDLIDRRRYNEDKSLEIIKGIKEIAPIYFVTGNHEGFSGKFRSLETKLKHAGVTILRNEKHIITRENEQIIVLGLDDPSFRPVKTSKNHEIIEAEISSMIGRNNEAFTILLCHRPEHFDVYSKFKVDLSLTGHAHGGQIGIPFIGALIVPNQGFPPKYYKGMYKIGGSKMIVSRGLGNSVFPQRLFNRPEIISISLEVVNV